MSNSEIVEICVVVVALVVVVTFGWFTFPRWPHLADGRSYTLMDKDVLLIVHPSRAPWSRAKGHATLFRTASGRWWVETCHLSMGRGWSSVTLLSPQEAAQWLADREIAIPDDLFRNAHAVEE